MFLKQLKTFREHSEIMLYGNVSKMFSEPIFVSWDEDTKNNVSLPFLTCKAAMAWKVVRCLRHTQSLLIPAMAHTSTLQSLIFASHLEFVSIY